MGDTIVVCPTYQAALTADGKLTSQVWYRFFTSLAVNYADTSGLAPRVGNLEIQVDALQHTTTANITRGQGVIVQGSASEGWTVGLSADSIASLALANTALQDAPSDGSTYGRRNGAWAITSGADLATIWAMT
jgi:hypothetical protein